jgi:hypothetical protein
MLAEEGADHRAVGGADEMDVRVGIDALDERRDPAQADRRHAVFQ